MPLGKTILKSRKKRGLSQEQLGERINVSRRIISNWELGKTSPNSEQLKLISKELNVSVDELLNNDNNIELKQEISEKNEEIQRKMNLWQIVFLVLGSPIWLSLLIVVFSILLSIYIILWSVIICFWAAFGSIFVGSLAMVLLGIIFTFSNKKLTGLAMISAGMTCIGLSILLFFVSKILTKGILLLTNKIIWCIKNFVSKMEVA